MELRSILSINTNIRYTRPTSREKFGRVIVLAVAVHGPGRSSPHRPIWNHRKEAFSLVGDYELSGAEKARTPLLS